MTNSADKMREVLVQGLLRLNDGLTDRQEVITTVYLPTKEFRLNVTSVASFGEKFLRFSGFNEAGYAVELILPIDQAAFNFEVAPTERTNRIGFTAD
jgi:hypothetical protein